MAIRNGLAVCVLMVAAGSAGAQQAPQAPAPAQPACSGWTCLFSSGRAPAPPPAPAQAAEAPAVVQSAGDGDRPPVKAAKPARVVTVAADPAETARLKALASHGFHLRFVNAADPEADLAVKPVFGAEAAETAGTRLFTVPMHVVAGVAIHSMADLKDKVVSFGPAGGPTEAAARKAFAALAISVKETPLDYDNAFDGLATGDVDAVVLLAPPPARKLAGIKGSGLHLVAWPEGRATPGGASLGAIPAASYPRLAEGGTPRAVNADAVLVMTAKGARQTDARAFLASLRQHSASLSKHGFNLIKADLAEHRGRHVASVEHR